MPTLRTRLRMCRAGIRGLLTILMVSGPTAASEPVVAATLEPVRELSLSGDATAAVDLRLEESGRPLLAVGGLGSILLPWPPATGEEPEEVHAANDIRFVATSAEARVAASFLYRIAWQDRGGGETPEEIGLEMIGGVDVYEDRLAVLGLQRYSDGMSRDGVIAWTGRLDSKPFSAKPLAYAAAGPGARPYFFCALMGLGDIRFLPDGRLVLAPGAEPGLFLFDRNGKLTRIWDTEIFEVGADCDFGEEEAVTFFRDEGARLRYLNRFRLIDAVLPFSFGPGLIVRIPGAEGPRWELLLLDADSEATLSLALPIKAPSPFARLRGDVRGKQLMLLYTEWVAGDVNAGARILELRLTGDVFGGAGGE